MAERMDRRRFLRTTAAVSAGTVLTGSRPDASAQSSPATGSPQDRPMIWGNLLHLSYNMWCDWDSPVWGAHPSVRRPYLRCDRKLWDDLLQKMVAAGMTMLVIDLGDGIEYQSHPEIAVRGAWTVDELRKELARIRKMGLEPIPKLNFSATHDDWLGPYSRCVSTDAYYAVCKDLIAEVIELFDKPRLFHLGMDEETAQHQQAFQYTVVRQYDLWWHDFYFYVEQVTRGGSRPWIWSDYVWHHPDEFFKKMPKAVVQSNWYYGMDFEKDVTAVKAYRDLDQHGYDQIPTGSNWTSPENFEMTVDYCTRQISGEHLMGFLQAPWHPTLEPSRQHHTEAIEQAGRAIADPGAPG